MDRGYVPAPHAPFNRYAIRILYQQIKNFKNKINIITICGFEEILRISERMIRMKIPAYIEIKNKAGKRTALLSPKADGLKNVYV